jgi:hypothetical protein
MEGGKMGNSTLWICYIKRCGGDKGDNVADGVSCGALVFVESLSMGASCLWSGVVGVGGVGYVVVWCWWCCSMVSVVLIVWTVSLVLADLVRVVVFRPLRISIPERVRGRERWS